MIRVCSPFAVLLAALIFVSTASAREKIELRLNGSVGDRHLVTVATDLRKTESYGTYKTQLRVQMRAVAETEIVEPRRDGALRMKMTYRQMALTENIDGLIIRYDSRRDAKSSSPMATIFNAMIGQSLTMVMNVKGKVLHVEGGEEFLNRLIAAMKLPADAQDEIKKLLKDSFSADKMADAMGAILLPEQAVAVGDSWQRNFIRKDEFFSTQIAQTSTLQTVQNNVATIEVREKIFADPKTKTIRTSGGQFKYLMSGHGTSSIRLNESSGQSMLMTTEQRISGKLIYETGDKVNGIHEPISFPVYSKQTMQAWCKKLPGTQN